MREKTQCKQYCSYQLQHLDRIEQFLEEKAKEGWIVYKHFGGLFSFKKEKPQNIRYYVEVFEKEKWNNSFENRVNQEYIKACGKKGWKFVHADSRFQIMCCENPSAKKPDLLKSGKINSIYKTCFKEYSYILLCLLFMALFNMFFSFTGIVKMLSSFSQLLYVSAWAILSIYLIGYMVSQKRWYDKAMDAAKRSGTIPDNPRHRFLYIGLILAIVILLLSILGFFIESHTYSSGKAFTRCLIILGVLSAMLVNVIGMDRQMSWKIRLSACVIIAALCIGVYGTAYRASSIFEQIHKTNTYESKVVYEDRLPVTLSSLGIKTDPVLTYTSYHEVYGEFLIKEDYYSEEPLDAQSEEQPSLCYRVYRTQNEYLYDRVLSDECFAANAVTAYEEVAGVENDAKKIYKKKLQTGYYEYIFEFDTQIIKMNINIELSSEQLQKIQAI